MHGQKHTENTNVIENVNKLQAAFQGRIPLLLNKASSKPKLQ